MPRPGSQLCVLFNPAVGLAGFERAPIAVRRRQKAGGWEVEDAVGSLVLRAPEDAQFRVGSATGGGWR
ncbi:MAG TPA: hypothetical protein VEF89_07195 [Solirubrobacteraceae bacterium]|nr:hypothetical protein [Solirubrobacteraceae bacterium]